MLMCFFRRNCKKNGLTVNMKGRWIYGSILCEMQRKKRNERPKGCNHEEW